MGPFSCRIASTAPPPRTAVATATTSSPPSRAPRTPLNEVASLLAREITDLEEMMEETTAESMMGTHVETRYLPLATVLRDALEQAQSGKGKERHARGDTPFVRQPILEIGRMVGLGFQTGQAVKKAQEAIGMAARETPEGRAAAVRELLGAINYLAAAVIQIREVDDADDLPF